MIYKVGIMGAHGTGKTTLALEIAAKLKRAFPDKSVGLVSEVARRCPLPINEAATTEAQLWIFCQQIQAEIEAGIRNDIVVCDRTVWDNLAYAKLREFEFVEFAEKFASCVDNYDVVIFMPVGGSISDDGFRSTEVGFQNRIDKIIRNMTAGQWWTPEFFYEGNLLLGVADKIKAYKGGIHAPNR